VSSPLDDQRWTFQKWLMDDGGAMSHSLTFWRWNDVNRSR
jgi:hypothetical protein